MSCAHISLYASFAFMRTIVPSYFQHCLNRISCHPKTYLHVLSEPFLINLPQFYLTFFEPSFKLDLSNLFQSAIKCFFIKIAIRNEKLGHSTNQCQAQLQCQL